MRKLVQVSIASIVIAVSSSCLAQVATGQYAFGSFDNKGFDTINVGNLNVMFNVPIIAKAGRAGTNFTYQLVYNSSIWTPAGVSGSQTWTPDQNWGWAGQTQVLTGYISEVIHNYYICNGIRTPWSEISGVVYHDSFGVAHKFTGHLTIGPCSGDGDTLTNTYSTDGEYKYTDQGIEDRRGVFVNAPVNSTVGAGTYTDNNGNEISTDGNGNFTDTTGSVVLSITGTTPTQSFTYKDSTGASRTIQVTYTTKSVQTNFGCSGVSEFSNASVPLITAITDPDGSSYQFKYEQTPDYPTGVTTGRIASVTLPTGGRITYTYSGGNNGISCSDGSTATLTRTLADDPGGPQSVYEHDASTAQTTVTDGLNNHTTYAFVPAGTSTPKQYIETDRNVYQGSNPGTLLLTRETCYDGVAPDCSSQSVTTPISQVDTYETLNGIQQSSSTAKYNAYDLQTEEDGYDFGGASHGPLLRKEVWTYPTSGIVGLVQNDTIYDGNGNISKETAYRYDETTPVVSSGVPQHVAVSGQRGNLTSLVNYVNSTSHLTTAITYEDTGSVLTSTPYSPYGFTTTYSYDPTFVYNLKVQLPTPSSGIVLSSSQTYDQAYTGLPKEFTDANGQPTTVYAYDSMLRPTEIDFPGGGKTTASYSPTQIGVYRAIDSSTSTNTQTLYDGYGRVSRVAVYLGATINQWYQQDTCYDADGRVSFKSYRYQGNGWGTPKVCSGAGDAYSYDAMGRLTSVTHGDGTSVQYSYSGRTAETMDENGVSKLTQVDGLGRTTAVCEVSSTTYESDPPSPCNMDISGLNGFLTTYSYAAGQTIVTAITQGVGVQTHIFQTDWLGRPTLVQQPELQGPDPNQPAVTTTYAYSVNATGRTMTRTRPTANQNNPSTTTTTTTQYDALGRIVSISYSDGTPTKTFAYDTNSAWQWGSMTPTNVKGRLYAAEAGNYAIGTVYSYDVMGRVNEMGECLPSGCGNAALDKLINYTHDLAGNMLTTGDGAGNTFTYTYSVADEVQAITSSLNDATHPGALVSAIQNGPDGSLNWQLGNGLYGVLSYDALGRNNGGWVCSGTNQTFCNGGGQVYGYTVAWSGSQATQVCDTVLNRCSSFGYDDLNRIASQTVTSGAAQNFAYVYDRYGNRWQQNVTAGSGPAPQFTFDKRTNHINSGGYSYDAAGNIISDGYHSYTYDAEGNVIAVDGGATATYTYDALNHRVRIDQGISGQEFVFNLNGQRISAWDAVSHNWDQGQAYWGSMPIEFNQGGAAHFQHQDWQGTERAQTSYNGSVEGTFTSLPFGDGYSVNGSDIDPYHFATLDKDYYGSSDSGTDHAQFRLYSDTQGRWMSPDPYSGSYEPGNPQSMNRYAYTGNQPLGGVDPSGLMYYLVLRDGGGGGASIGIAPNPGEVGLDAWNEFDLMDMPIMGDPEYGSYWKYIGSHSYGNNTFSDDYESAVDWFLPYIGTGLDLLVQTNLFGPRPTISPAVPSLSKLIPKVPVNLTAIVPVVGIFGPAVTFTYLPQTDNFCVAPGIGASVGRNLSAGLLMLGNLANAKAITEGASISVGAQATPLIGAQATGNLSGILGGPTVGIPGGSVTATYGVCF